MDSNERNRKLWGARRNWEKQFEREVMETVMGRRTGTQRPYVEISEEKKITER